MSKWGIDPEWEAIFQPIADRLDHLLSMRSDIDLPAADLTLRAFTTSPSSIRAVIVGQDPYPTPGHANGLAFSVSPNVRPLPSSLRNIFKELCNDLGFPAPSSGDLTHWFNSGVLLINRTLTVTPGQAGSHRGRGWEEITYHAIESLTRTNPVPAILWGKPAQELVDLFPYAICSPHPSPLSAHRGFFGSRPFSRINHYLQSEKKHEIEWRLP